MHSTGLDLYYLAFGNMLVFIYPKEFSNAAAGTDELLCSAASITGHVANIYSRANFAIQLSRDFSITVLRVSN